MINVNDLILINSNSSYSLEIEGRKICIHTPPQLFVEQNVMEWKGSLTRQNMNESRCLMLSNIDQFHFHVFTMKAAFNLYSFSELLLYERIRF